MANENEKVKIVGYAKRDFYNDGIEYRNFSDDLVGLQKTTKGGTSLFTNGNFSITTNTDNTISKIYGSNSFSNYYTLDNISNDNFNITNYITKNITLNNDKADLSMYALFGSLKEFIRVSMEDIITNWVASIYIRDNDVYDPNISGPTFGLYTYNETENTSNFRINKDRVENHYELNFNEDITNYNSFSVNNELRDIVSNFNKYVLDINGSTYEIIDFVGTSSVSNYLNITVKGNPFFGVPNTTRYHIRPNDVVREAFFKNLSDFSNYLLNRLTTPKYSATFKYPIRDDNGSIVYKNEKLTWATTDGYNLDFNTTQYINYAKKLFSIADQYDDNVSDLMVRELTSDSITDFDSVKTTQGEFVESESQKMTRTLRIYGRNFDEINKYITGISFANVITYDKKDNAPDDVVKNIARVLGWELTSSLVDNTLLNTFLETSKTTYDGYSRGLTKNEAEIEMWRRLILNTPWIWKSKGTRKAIEFLLDFIGTPKGLINFNEYVYVADEPVDVDEVIDVMDSLFSVTSVDLLPIDSEGYPKPYKNGDVVNGEEKYFQKGGKWWRKTGGENSDNDILSGNNPHIGPYDSGKAFIKDFNAIIPNFSAVTISNEEEYIQNKNLFNNYNNGLISDLSVETVIAVSEYNTDISSLFTIESPEGGCLYASEWGVRIYIDEINVGEQIILKNQPETRITLPNDADFIENISEILIPLDIEVIIDDAPISDGKIYFRHDTNNCESSLYLNSVIKVELFYNSEKICIDGNPKTISEAYVISSNTFNYNGTTETYNILVDSNNQPFINENGGFCYTLNSEIIEDPKPSLDETECGCEVQECDQSLKFSITYEPYQEIIYPCLVENNISGFEILTSGIIEFKDINNTVIPTIPQECCEQFGFIYSNGVCRCSDPNNPPTVEGFSFNLLTNSYTFNNTNFITNFTDSENDAPNMVKINSLPSVGILKYNGTNVKIGDTFNYLDAPNLVWVFNGITNETDGNYFYEGNLEQRKQALLDNDYRFLSYQNGLYTYSKTGDNLLPVGVDGTFESFPVAAPSSGFNADVTGSGWINGRGTADTHNQPVGNVARGCPPSPQGGIFAGGICGGQPQSPNYQESFYTNIPIKNGSKYIISFYQVHAGDDIGGGAKVGDSADWEVVFDGTSKFTRRMAFQGFGNQTWEYAELEFTANRNITAKIEFVAGKGIILGSNIRGCYVGIDDIKIQELVNTTTETSYIHGNPLTETCFDFQISDDYESNPLYSNVAAICVNGSTNNPIPTNNI